MAESIKRQDAKEIRQAGDVNYLPNGYIIDTPQFDYLNAQPGKETKALNDIYPGWGNTGNFEKRLVDLPISASAYFGFGMMPNQNSGEYESPDGVLGKSKAGKDTLPISRRLPDTRGARYAILRRMALDPTIDSAIKMHIANAFSNKNNTVDSIVIESADGKDNEYVDSIRAVIMPYIRKDLNEWARKAAVYGSCFVRVYGAPKEGITNLRCDFYTNPRYVNKFEKGGRLAGYTTTYQGMRHQENSLRLLPPWTFVGFEIPEWWDREWIEPHNVTGIPIDLADDNEFADGLVESIDYGTSLIATAYGPWLDLLDAVCSLRMSRRNAARLERIIGVNTEKLDPERAAHYLDLIAERITNSSAEIENQSWLYGNAQTVINHIVPLLGSKGGISIDSVVGTPDIQGIEDVLYHIKRLGSALGVDPSLLGFGDMLSGGLGDGGFFRVSSIAAVKANLLRVAIRNGIQRLCEIHCAYKYNKVFTVDECPWKITFNSIATALEREEQENLDLRTNSATMFTQLLGGLDQEFSLVDKRELIRHIWRQLRMDDQEFETIFPEKKAKEAEATPEENQNTEGEEEFGEEEEV